MYKLRLHNLILTRKNSIHFILCVFVEISIQTGTKMISFSLLLILVEPNYAVCSWQSLLVWVMNRILWVCIIAMMLKALLDGWRSALLRCVTKCSLFVVSVTFLIMLHSWFKSLDNLFSLSNPFNLLKPVMSLLRMLGICWKHCARVWLSYLSDRMFCTGFLLCAADSTAYILVSGNQYTMGWKSIFCFQPTFWSSGQGFACQSFYGMWTMPFGLQH